MSGDEFYDDDVTSGIDPDEGWRRGEMATDFEDRQRADFPEVDNE